MESVADYMIRPLYPEEIHLLRDFRKFPILGYPLLDGRQSAPV